MRQCVSDGVTLGMGCFGRRIVAGSIESLGTRGRIYSDLIGVVKGFDSMPRPNRCVCVFFLQNTGGSNVIGGN